MTTDLNIPESRVTPRRAIRLRVDVKPLKTKDVDSILFGEGFEDLGSHSLSLSRPRQGMEKAQSLDLSSSGLRLTGADLKPGTAAVVDIHLPEERVVIKALAEVIWTSQGEEAPQAGLRFAAMQGISAELMKDYLKGSTLN